MDSHLNQIQALIDEIEGVLQQPAPRLPWMGETTRESRALLDRVRGYLLKQQQTLVDQSHRPPTPPPTEPATESAEQLLQSVMQEMKGLRSSVVQPLREDIEALQRQRDELLQEIRHLDTQRQTKASLAQQSAQQQQIIAEFLQTLMGRLHDSINQQIGQTLNQIENEFFNDDASTQYQTAVLEGSEAAATPEYIPVWDPSAVNYAQRLTGPLHPRERLAQLRMFQHKIDEMILTLDSTVSVVFETLLQNVQVYEASLSKRLESMHNLSRQSEEMFAGLVTQFAQTLEQNVSASLQGTPETEEIDSSASVQEEVTEEGSKGVGEETARLSASQPRSTATTNPSFPPQGQPTAPPPQLEEDWLQLLETEESSLLSGSTPAAPRPVSEAGMEQQINQLYDDLFTSEETTPPVSVPETPESDWFEESFLDDAVNEEPLKTSMPISGIPSSESEEFLVEFQPFDEDTASLILDEPTEDFFTVENEASPDMTSHASVQPALTDEVFPEFEPFDEDTASVLFDQPDPLETSKPPAAGLSVDSAISKPPRPSRPKTSPPETRTAELSLKDLFSETTFPVETPVPSPATPSPASLSSTSDTYEPLIDENWVVEGFIPASPDEDLLSVSEFEEEEPEPSFAINPMTLNQLKQDLFSLEEGEEETSVQRWDDDLFETASTPLSVSPELLPHQNWDSNSLEEWATELDRALSQSQTETAAYNTPISEEEEELLASVDDWFTQLSEETPESTSESSAAQPALPITDPSTLTLDEAFASMGASAMPPSTGETVREQRHQSDASEELDLFETAQWIKPAEEMPVSVETPRSSSALDDLFAGLTASQDPELDQSDELFAFSDWQTPEDIDAETDEFETSKLDDLFSTIMDEPSAAASEAEPDLFFTMDNPDFLNDDPLPEKLIGEGEKKNEESLTLKWESEPVLDTLIELDQKEADPFDLSASILPATSRSGFFLEDWEIKKEWYLSIDFGTTGLSATLFHHKSHELYPIYWRDPQAKQPHERCFRLPSAVILTASSSSTPFDLNNTQLSLTLHPDRLTLSDNQILFTQFKPYLKVGITGIQNGQTPTTTDWEPVIQWSEHHQISLSLIQQALALLISTLNPAQPSSTLECNAVDLDAATFKTACEQLAGVILSVPTTWPDSYSFNLREAVLGAGLVKQPEQIMVVSEAIAAVLSGLRGAAGEKILKPRTFSEKLNFNSNADWLGGTVVITSGANVTELALVNLPSNLQSLTYSDFYLQTLAYAGNAIDQDILCQLLLLRTDKDSRKLEALDPSLIKLSAFEALPEPGEPMLEKRYRMQQLLESSAAGQLLLAAANQLKLILQHQEEFTLKLGQQRWVCGRKELEQRVLVPYVQQLNRELNLLLAESGMQPVAIKQVICTGGTASLPAISRWLRQKFSNATIIQDTYPPDRGPACSRIAYGLATVPLHPQVFDVQRQQYNDYFLLRELLSVFPNHPCTFAEVLQLLERQGINTRSCQSRLLTFLENRLPAGIHLDPGDRILLTDCSFQDPEYLTLQATPLFYSQENQTYRPNPQQFQRVRRHLNQLMARTHQQIEEPFTINLGQRLP